MTQDVKISIFDEWAEVTTAHGFSDFSRARSKIGKVIWFLLIFISLTLMCYQLFRGVSVFASHEWKTSIQESRSKDEGGVPFPSIVVCNVNRLKFSKTQEYNMTLDMIRFFFMNLIPFSNYLQPSINKTTKNEFMKWRKAHNFTLRDIFDKMGPLIFNRENLSGKQNLSTVYTTEYGRCLRIDVNINSTRVGSKGGSLFIFNNEGWDYLPIIENNNILEGLALQVAYDANIEVGKWIMMHPGTQVVVGIQAVQETVREVDRSIFNPFALLNAEPPCERSPELKFFNTSHYSQINCEVECLWLIPISLCNCTPLFATPAYKECEIEEYYECFAHGRDDNFTTITSKCVVY